MEFPATPHAPPSPSAFLAGGGELGALIRDHDWAATPLGPPATWPQSLRQVVRLMLDTRHPMLIFWGPDLLQLYNDAYRATLGPERHPAALGQRGRDCWDEVWPIIGPDIDHVMAGRGATWHEDTLVPVTRHGRLEQVWWTYGYSPIDDETRPGRVGGILVTCNDVTGRHQAAEQYRLSEARLRLALDSSGEIGTWDWDLLTDRVVADALAAQLCGIDPAAAAAGVAPHEPIRSIHPEDRARTNTALAAAMAPPGSLDIEYRILSSDGTIRWIHARGRCHRGTDGRPLRLLGTMVDITQRRRAQDSLHERTATLEARVAERTRQRDQIWQFSPDPLGVARADGVLLAVNPAWTECLGWSAVELRARPFDTLLHPADVAADAADVPVATGQREARMRHKDGTWRWMSWQARRDGELVYLVGRDVTAAKAAAAALAQTEDALRQAQKMEAVGQLTGGIAHDFNNLLTGIVGALHMMRRRIAEGRVAELPRYAGIALQSAERAASLTQRLLAFARRQPLDPRPVDANHLVGAMRDLVSRTLGPPVKLDFAPAAGLWATLCDPHQLENAILNMAINARDAMPEGGRLTITTANARLTAAEAQAWGGESGAGDYVAIGLTDTGSGMTPEVAAKAFEPFFTTKPSGQGTGLGLSMLYGFVRQSGGQLRLDTAAGRGTTLWIYLPRHHGTPAVPQPGETAQDAAQGPTGRPAPGGAPDAGADAMRGTVLVVEDEPAVRGFVVEVLEDLGLRVMQAAEGAAGLSILHSAAAIDLLVTDIGLPGGLNGRQMADAARQRRADLPVLFITGYAHGVLDGETTMLEPGVVMLTKPFTLDALTEKIRSILGPQAKGQGLRETKASPDPGPA